MLFCRDYLTGVVSRRFTDTWVNSKRTIDDTTLFLSSSAVVDKKLVDKINGKIRTDPKREFSMFKSGEILCTYLRSSANDFAEALLSQDFEKIVRFSGDARLDGSEVEVITFPWELIGLCQDVMTDDLGSMITKKGGKKKRRVGSGLVIFGKDYFIDERSTLEPNVVIRADTGPVYISRGAVVQSSARIEGPTYVGEDTLVVGGAQVRRGSVMGPNCRVGGEMDASIMHGFSNKYHFSFLSHSYVGEWVNIGAGFISSNLKNTYGTIRSNVGERLVDTGMTKYGCLLADHCKTSVGALVNSGRKVGVASHISGFVTDDVPSFTFYAKNLNGKQIELDLNRVLITQKRVMARRSVEQTPGEIELMKTLYELTRDERARADVSKGSIKI